MPAAHRSTASYCKLGLLLLTVTVLGGCQRTFFRNKADKESAAVIEQSPKDSDWEIQNYHVYPDPRARFAEVSDPDRPPMPPDDPAAYNSAPNPQKPGKAGIALEEGTGYLQLLALWNQENRAELGSKKKLDEDYVGGRSESPPKPHEQSELELAAHHVAQPAVEAGLVWFDEYSEPKETGLPFETIVRSTAPPDNEQQLQPSTSRDVYPNPLDLTGQPEPYLINLEQSLQMALLNSREFQDRREDLYLTSLPVTVERFAFSTQLFAAGQTIREYTGSLTGEGLRNRWLSSTNAGFSKLFSTGALLLLQFANRTVIEMTGDFDPKTISTSMLNLDLIQPLLRGAGRSVTLEPLTLVERNLLYEIRDFARFRKQFYVSIASGAGLGGLNIGSTRFRNRAPTFAAAGRVAGAIIGVSRGGISNLPASTIGGAPTAGYLQTIVNAALLQNEQRNVDALSRTLREFRNIEPGGDVSQLQVDQVEQNLLAGRNTLFQREQALMDALDRFKIQLGLPVTLPIELNNAPLRPQTEQLDRFEQLLLDLVQARDDAESLGKRSSLAQIRARLRNIGTTSPLVRGIPFQTEFPKRWAVWEQLSATGLQQRLNQLIQEQGALQNLFIQGLARAADDQRRLEVGFEINLGTFEASLRAYENHPWYRQRALLSQFTIGSAAFAPLADDANFFLLQRTVPPDANPRIPLSGGAAGWAALGGPLALLPTIFHLKRIEELQAQFYRPVFNSFVLLLLEARNERLEKARSDWPELPRLDVDRHDLLKTDLETAQELASRTALTQRLDLMNARAQLVDSWRQIKIAANSLLGVFNVEYHLRSETPPGLAKPFAFSGSRSRHQLVFNWELPLVRILERNNYRASLIAWQRQRRQLMLTQDSVVLGIRAQVRNLRVLAVNYAIQRRAVEIAYLRVESARDSFKEPLPPGVTPTAERAAALTQQLLGAQSDLIRAQNTLISLWVDYLTTRMQLYRDLGTMRINSQGVWIDDAADRKPLQPPLDP